MASQTTVVWLMFQEKFQEKNQYKVRAQVLTGQTAVEKKKLFKLVMMYFIGAFLLLAMSVMQSTAQASSNLQSDLLSVIDEAPVAEVPDTPAEMMQLAEQLLDKQNFGQALSYYTKVIRQDRSVDEAFLGRSLADGGIGKVEESIADLNVYILRNPEHSMAHVYRGVRYMSRGDIEEAEENLLKAIELNPRNAQAFDDLGVLYAQLGELEVAMKLFGQALRIDPYNEMAYHNLAIGYYMLEQNDKALIAVNRAIRLMPEERDSYILKAQILDALGKKDEADQVRHYSQYLGETTNIEAMLVN